MDCNFTNISRTHSYVNIFATTKRPLYNFRGDVTIFTKLKGEKEFKRLLYFPKIDACSFTEQIDSKFSVLKSQILYLNYTMNGSLHKCPYTKFEVTNFTLSLHGDEKLEYFNLPNGVIKTRIQLYNNRDKNIIFFEMVVLKNIVKINNWGKLVNCPFMYRIIWCANKNVINLLHTNSTKVHNPNQPLPTLFSQLNLNLSSSTQRWWLLIQWWDASSRDKMFSKHTKINLRENSFNWNEKSAHNIIHIRVVSRVCRAL